mgnify:CR=1 FL=1
MFVWIFILSRDAGSGMMYPIIYMGMALAAGLAWYWFALAIGSLGVGIGLLAVFEKLPKYWMDRFHVILDHSSRPRGVRSRAMKPMSKSRNSHHFSAKCSMSTLEKMK